MFLFLLSFFLVFPPQKTSSISYKILQMRMLYTNPRRDAVVPSYIEAHWLNKRERMTIVAWRRIVVFRLHRIHPSRHCIGSLDWLQLHSISPAVTLLDARFDWKTPFYTVVSRESKVQIGLNNSNTTWALTLIGVEWIYCRFGIVMFLDRMNWLLW